MKYVPLGMKEKAAMLEAANSRHHCEMCVFRYDRKRYNFWGKMKTLRKYNNWIYEILCF